MRKKRRKYTPEFRIEAVRLVEGGLSISQAARDLSIPLSVLCDWVKAAEKAKAPPAAGDVTPLEREELLRLRKENEQLRMEREFLKKAAAFFAKEHK